jgi:hypothetical protein
VQFVPENNNLRLVAWGVGVPLLGRRDSAVQQTASKFEHFSTRNYDRKEEMTYVPCPSCLSLEFDKPREIQNDVVVFTHKKKTPNLNIASQYPLMSNENRPFSEVLDFIGSGETVVTSSYHGVFWAQLMGRKVLCVPYSEKFMSFESSPPMSTQIDWKNDLLDARAVPNCLDRYRNRNLEFLETILESWDNEPSLVNGLSA